MATILRKIKGEVTGQKGLATTEYPPSLLMKKLYRNRNSLKLIDFFY